MIVKVLIDNPVKKLNKVYNYLVKEEDLEKIQVGKRVLVNFGNGSGRSTEGIIVKVSSENTSDLKLKYIEEILDTESYIDEYKLKLAKWISRMYFCNVYTALKLMLPDGGEKLKKKDIHGKQITVVTLNKEKDIIEDDIDKKKITSARHIKLLRELEDSIKIPLDDIVNNLGITKAVINKVKENGYIKLIKEDVDDSGLLDVPRTEKLNPTKEQKKVIDSLIDKLNNGKFNISLLYGITGSGKTEVYLQAIEECLRLGKTAIVLVPEISLTAQTKSRFISRFGDVVSVLHSKMTRIEKQTEFKKILDLKSKIVIGPRSALFVPLKNIGLVIIDEEHDSSYISGTTPRYNTKEVASKVAYDNNAILLLGSATPEISTMYKAKSGKIDYYELLSRPKGVVPPEMEIVDMKEEALYNKSSILSSRLKEEIAKNLENKEQTFIFLNRRGFSTYIVCENCGKVLRCPNCDVNLTYHKKRGLLLCHYCSYCETLNSTCPYCKEESLKEIGVGTEKVEQELRETFKDISVLRMDMDTTVKRGSHEKILNRFKNDGIDVLVGTQMIAKGHDIENVTLVGIINADMTGGEDYNSSEKTFSSLLQVSGRAGRGRKKGRVIMQATNLNSYILDSVYNNSYDKFYKKEIEFRKALNYPPFTDLLVIELTSKYQEKVVKESKKIYDIFSENKNELLKVYSPKVPYIGKINNKYRIQMVIKSILNKQVLDLVYENLDKYDKIKDSNVNISVIRNPVKIG